MSQDFHQNRHHHHHQSFDDEQVDKIHQSFVGGGQVVYETAGMLSEMFDFGGGRASGPGEQLLPARSPQQQFHGQPQYTWIPDGVVEGQGLSLSLASSEEMRMSTAAAGTGYPHPHPHPHEMMFFNAQEGRPSTSSNSLQQHLHFGFNTASSSVFSLAAVNVLRNSNYTRPAQELLDEFCSVGRAHLNKTTATSKLAVAANNTTDPPPLSPADKMEHQRRKVKLAAMLDEVERRYSHYCEQMQMVVNSYDMVMGFGAAVPYTALAQKAMSRHFRCLKDSIQAQLKHSSELLGEKDATGGTGITKGETPRLKVLEQSLRKQRAFHQMGMMEQEAWRPQRGLPERSVNVLRAWLFEHFLNPYPSDADKHLLARQTGLSRNQVANWFINARVRLWKPMIEEMYQQDKSKNVEDEGGEEDEDVVSDKDEEQEVEEQTTRERESNSSAQTSTYPPVGTTTVSHTFKAHLMMPNRHHHQHPAVGPTTNSQGFIQATASSSSLTSTYVVDAFNNHFTGTSTSTAAIVDDNSGVSGPTMIRFGTTPATNAGDVSLTLGLRHGSAEKGGFIFRDFGTS